MSDFNTLLNSPAKVLSEQHDADQIDISTEQDGWDPSTITRTRVTSGWDAGEYGVSYAQAKKMSETEEGRRELRERAKNRANLATSQGRICAMVAGEAPWHGLGTNVAEAVYSKEAMRLSGLEGWNLTKEPAVAVVGDVHVTTDKYVVTRHDTEVPVALGVVGQRYEIWQNEDCFSFMDEVLAEYGAVYETAGALGNGERVWLQAKMPSEVEIADGDTLAQYVMFGTSHDGTQSTWIWPTSLRTVCQNTYRQSFGRKKGGAFIRHTQNAKKRAQEVKQQLGLAKQAMDKFAEMASTLAQSEMQCDPVSFFQSCIDDFVGHESWQTVGGERVTAAKLQDGTIDRALLAVIKADDREREERKLKKIINRRQAMLDDIQQRFETERNNGHQSISGSVWAAVNAVTENLNHSPLHRFVGEPRKKAESKFDALMQGRLHDATDAVMGRAMDMATAS